MSAWPCRRCHDPQDLPAECRRGVILAGEPCLLTWDGRAWSGRDGWDRSVKVPLPPGPAQSLRLLAALDGEQVRVLDAFDAGALGLAERQDQLRQLFATDPPAPRDLAGEDLSGRVGCFWDAEERPWILSPPRALRLTVLAYSQRLRHGRREIGEIWLGLPLPDGNWQVLWQTEPSAAEFDRQQLLASLEPLRLEAHDEAALFFDARGVRLQLLRPDYELVVRAAGSEAARMELPRLDPGRGMMLGRASVPRLRQVCLTGERADADPKALDPHASAEFLQLQLRAPLLSTPARPTPAQIVARTVLSHSGKDGPKVRKALILTSDGSNGRPAWMLFSSDYSPARKDTLQARLQACATRAEAERALADWLQANHKRGWQQIDK